MRVRGAVEVLKGGGRVVRSRGCGDVMVVGSGWEGWTGGRATSAEVWGVAVIVGGDFGRCG